MIVYFIAELDSPLGFFSKFKNENFDLGDNYILFFKDNKENPRKPAIKVVYEVNVDHDIYKFIDSFIYENKYLMHLETSIKLPLIDKLDNLYVEANGELKHDKFIHLNQLPYKVEKLCLIVESEIQKKLQRFLQSLIWYQNLNSQFIKEISLNLFWKTRKEEKLYHLIPLKENSGSITGKFNGVYWVDNHVDNFQNFYNQQFEIPLAHELLREAYNIMKDSLRSSFILMVVSLEIAIKQHIGRVLPQSYWLLDNMPSPPIQKLFNTYLLELHPILQGDNEEYWNNIKKVFNKPLQTLIENRNKIVHTGWLINKKELNKEYVENSYYLISDLIYFLDALEGHEWAKNHISEHLLIALGWQKNGEVPTSKIVTISSISNFSE